MTAVLKMSEAAFAISYPHIQPTKQHKTAQWKAELRGRR
jgi:hypothetical protein